MSLPFRSLFIKYLLFIFNLIFVHKHLETIDLVLSSIWFNLFAICCKSFESVFYWDRWKELKKKVITDSEVYFRVVIINICIIVFMTLITWLPTGVIYGSYIYIKLSGVILLVVGSVIQASNTYYDPVLDESFFSVPVLLIIIGAIIFVVSFFGCCGAYKENYCLTISFCVSLIFIFILELSGGIAGYLLRDRVSDVLGAHLRKSMFKYNVSGENNNSVNQQIHIMWDEMQRSLHCCGDNSTESWLEVQNALPISCCEENIKVCDVKSAYKENCMTGLITLLESNAGILGGVGVGIAIIQLLGIVFACNLASSIRDYESV